MDTTEENSIRPPRGRGRGRGRGRPRLNRQPVGTPTAGHISISDGSHTYRHHTDGSNSTCLFINLKIVSTNIIPYLE